MADLDVYFPFDAGAGADVLEAGWRSMARNWLTSGPIRLELNSFLVAADSGRNVLLSSGRCWIIGHYGELTADTTVAITTNTSGNPRIDRIVLRADFVNNKLEYAVLQGTPAGSPVAPTLTQNTSIWEISLAQLSLASGYSSIPAGNITDERRWASGRPPGGPFLIACAANLSTTNTVTIATWEDINFDGADDYDTASIHSSTTNTEQFIIPGGCTGLWTFSCIVTWNNTSTLRHAVRIVKNGSVLKTFGFTPAMAETADADKVIDAGYIETALVPGDVIKWQVRFDSADGAGDPVVVIAALGTARYVGSLVA